MLRNPKNMRDALAAIAAEQGAEDGLMLACFGRNCGSGEMTYHLQAILNSEESEEKVLREPDALRIGYDDAILVVYRPRRPAPDYLDVLTLGRIGAGNHFDSKTRTFPNGEALFNRINVLDFVVVDRDASWQSLFETMPELHRRTWCEVCEFRVFPMMGCDVLAPSLEAPFTYGDAVEAAIYHRRGCPRIEALLAAESRQPKAAAETAAV